MKNNPSRQVMYRDVSPVLHPVARLSVLSHLQKLEREGRAVRLSGDPPRFHVA